MEQLHEGILKAIIASLLGYDEETGLYECFNEKMFGNIKSLKRPFISGILPVNGQIKAEMRALRKELIGDLDRLLEVSGEEDGAEKKCREYLFTLIAYLASISPNELLMMGSPEEAAEGYFRLNTFIGKSVERSTELLLETIPYVFLQYILRIMGAYNEDSIDSSSESHQDCQDLIVRHERNILRGIRKLSNVLVSPEEMSTFVDDLVALSFASKVLEALLKLLNVINKEFRDERKGVYLILSDELLKSHNFYWYFIMPKRGTYSPEFQHYYIAMHYFAILVEIIRELSEITPISREEARDLLEIIDKMCLKSEDTQMESEISKRMTKYIEEGGRDFGWTGVKFPSREYTRKVMEIVERLPWKMLEGLSRVNLIRKADFHGALVQLWKPVAYDSFLRNHHIYELLVLSALAKDGLLVLPSHKWRVDVKEINENGEDGLLDRLDQLADGTITKNNSTYLTKEIDGLFLIDREIVLRSNILRPIWENFSWGLCSTVLGLVEVTRARNKAREEVTSIQKGIKFLDELSNYHQRCSIGLLVVGDEVRTHNIGSLVISPFEEVLSLEGRIPLYRSMISALTPEETEMGMADAFPVGWYDD